MVDVSTVLAQVFDPYLLGVVLATAAYGLVIGAIPGLTALMSVALLVPIVTLMDPIPAVAAIITCSSMAIFAGDIPGALLRMPGTPASAAYTDDAHGLTREGKSAVALGCSLVASVIGGLISAVVLMVAAPSLASIALSFSSVEYFWLAVVGLSCAIFVAGPSLVKGLASLFLGLGIATIGMDPVGGIPRFTFGDPNLLSGPGLIPVLIGFFALSELLRGSQQADGALASAPRDDTSLLRIMPGLVWRHKVGVLRGGAVGTLVGTIPGAGQDIAAWISYAITGKVSRVGARDDDAGRQERIMSAGASNNASVGGAYIPATVFGIPGDAVTAIVISVLFLKGLNPGPTLFLNHPETIYTIFAIFFVANLVMIPLGVLCIRAFGLIVRIPAAYIAPSILMFCILGAFAVENTLFSVGVIAVIGMLGYMMEANEIPFAPAVLGLILGPMIEQSFMTTMLKSSGDLAAFVDRPLGLALGAVTALAWLLILAGRLMRRRGARQA
ncbi:tripartite tricarboxylate transporter permease [Orrella sp. JC864]|uniref:tripartite tricarboxylate transporter permease n=1 Tax=Orrella sp. JC864 TaxID=3120298 RepID=UPI00300A351E